MTKKILFILLFQFLAFSGYSQDTIPDTEQPNRILEVSPAAVVDPPPCDDCPTGYQWNKDFDKDGFGDPSQVLFSQTKPNGYVANQQDCNDNDISINPNTIWYRDADGDGYGVSTPRLVQCVQPTGYVRNASDYNDSTANITNIAPSTFYRDADSDTFGNPTVTVYYSLKPTGYVINNSDCNDNDVSLNPNTVWYRDADADGYGHPSVAVNSCTQPAGYVRNGSDYNDSTANINNIAPQYFYLDADGDSFGNPNVNVYYSANPAGYVTNNLDCNDGDASLTPYTVWYRDADGDGYGNIALINNSCIQPAGYVRNGADFDDSTVNITTIAPQHFYLDADGDNYGNPAVSVYYSYQPSSFVTNGLDCNDADASLNPNTVWYRDADADGYGHVGITIISCNQPAGYVRNAADYNDATANITNIAPQTFYQDSDGDSYGNPAVYVDYSYQPGGYVANNSDYNDTTVNITNIAPQYFYQDADNDSFGNANIKVYYSIQPTGYVANSSDYNDTTVNITNIAPRYFYQDADNDSFGNTNVNVYYSIQPTGYVANNSDYNDTTANIINIAPQYFYQDADNDSFGNANVNVYYSIQPPGFVTNSSDCNDGDNSLNPNTKWYADTELDGLGDPANYVQQCTVPNGNYVRNSDDNCPTLQGTNADCSNITNPSSDHNYIITKTYKKPTAVTIDAAPADQVQTNITYFDGLGRPMQQIANKQSSSGKDIVTHIGYDDFGRQLKEYLPYESSSTNMAFDVNAESGTVTFYATEKYENTANPFSQKQLESSPLNRVLKQAAPGTSWAMGSGHEIKLDYQTNTADEVKLYKATATWDSGSGLYEPAFSEAENYAENQLYKNVTFDENTTANPSESSGSTVEFKNKEGQVILKRTYESGNKHDTYYVYDIYGNLTYVIPPKADGDINEEVLNGLCYQYKYDYRNRLAEKKLPGKQWEFIVYDKLDRPVATGPALSPFKDDSTVGWLITKYDAFGRPIYTGWKSETADSATRKSLQDAQNLADTLFETTAPVNIDGIATNYNNSIAPTSFKLLTVNYYDDYTFPEAQSVPSAIMGQGVLANVKGLPTGSWTRVLTTASSIAGETTTTFYDSIARPISAYIKNHLTGNSHTDNKLDFNGKTLNTLTEHQRVNAGPKITVEEEFTYSPQDRLRTHTHQINGGVVQLLAANTYDELGQLTSKNVGNSTGSPLQKVDFNYNIRGWLTEINKTDELQQNTDPVDLFAFKINYDKTQTEIPNVRELYNGNISETFWKTGSDNLERSYGYQYDKLNRLTSAIYQKSKLTTDSYNENLSYDKNGNIQFLNRNGDMDPQIGTNVIDNLSYTYPDNSNQLSKVVDSANKTSGFKDANTTGDDYSYDVNGNMISDKNKNITEILYNQLNLPKKISFGTGNTIEYIYNAAGQKLEKIVKEGTTTTNTNYLGGFQYKDNILEFFPTAEGYVKNTEGTLSYVFQYKDHLGNVRLSFAKNPTTQVLEIIEENNYYPFGLKHKGYNDYVATGNKYKYNGKELQDELGLNFYDYGARNYDPALGRWMNIDPLAEKSRRFSPYVYALNNPVYYIDPDGMEAYPPTEEFLGNLGIQVSEIQNGYEWTDSDGSWKYNSENKSWEGQNGTDFNIPAETQHLDDVIVSNTGKGESYGAGAGIAVGGGFGVEAGLVKDSQKNWGAYFSFKANYGFGESVGIEMSEITPQHDGMFMLGDFAGTSIEASVGVNSPIGGGGVSFGGTSPQAEYDLLDTFRNIGTDARGYTTGAVSPGLNAPSAKVNVGAMVSNTTTWVWDF